MKRRAATPSARSKGKPTRGKPSRGNPAQGNRARGQKVQPAAAAKRRPNGAILFQMP